MVKKYVNSVAILVKHVLKIKITVKFVIMKFIDRIYHNVNVKKVIMIMVIVKIVYYANIRV